MHVQRFLGSEWVSVHGPGDPRRALLWVLDSGFDGVLAAPGPRPVDWPALFEASEDVPVTFPAVRAASTLSTRFATAGLSAAHEGQQDEALAAVRLAVATGRTLACPRVILEPGLVPVMGEIESDDLGDASYGWTRERAEALLARRKVGRHEALDRACRAVHALVRACPDIEFCVTSGRNLRSVADREGLQDLFEDLHQLRIGYWHDAGIAARREQIFGEAQGEWLEEFGNRCWGMSLGDASPDGMHLPPGAGGVDYGLLATYVPRGNPFPVALELDPSVAIGELAGMRSCLDKYGL